MKHGREDLQKAELFHSHPSLTEEENGIKSHSRTINKTDDPKESSRIWRVDYDSKIWNILE